MLGGKPPALGLTDVGHEILDRTVFESGDRFAGFSFQCAASRALGVVDLHHRGDAVSEEREILCGDSGLDPARNVPAATADEARNNRAQGDIPEKIASAACHPAW